MGVGVASMHGVEKTSAATALGGLLDGFMLPYEQQEDVCYASASCNCGIVT
jgi:hypothetical protein